MKLALVHMRHRGTGGTERYLNQMAAHLAANGHAVTILCRSHEEAPHPAVRFVVLRGLATGGAWRMWAFARAVERHARRERYDVVYGLGKTWTHDVVRLGGGCHQTYLDTAHEATLAPWKRFAGRYALKHLLALRIEARALQPSSVRRVITNSMMVKRDVMSRHGVAPEKITVIYNGVDVERFHPRRRETDGVARRRACGFGERDFVVLFLGTGYGRKGLQPLLDAFPALLGQRPEARLLVVGYDSARSRFERAAQRSGIGSRATFLGGRRDPEACFAAADVYVLPTFYDPFANTTLEALATGLPVVTTIANGASEVLTHRVTGSIIDTHALPERLLDELLFWSAPGQARAALPVTRALAAEYREERMLAASTRVLEEVAEEKRRSQAPVVPSAIEGAGSRFIIPASAE